MNTKAKKIIKWVGIIYLVVVFFMIVEQAMKDNGEIGLVSAIVLVAGMLVFIISFFALIVGMIKPSIVVRWGDSRTRKQVFKYYGLAFLISFIGVGVSGLVEVEEIETTVESEKVDSETKDTMEVVAEVEQEVQEEQTAEKEKTNLELLVEDKSDYRTFLSILCKAWPELTLEDDVFDIIESNQLMGECINYCLDSKIATNTLPKDFNDSFSMYWEDDFRTTDTELYKLVSDTFDLSHDMKTKTWLLATKSESVQVSTEAKKKEKYEIVGDLEVETDMFAIYISGVVKNNSGRDMSYAQITFNLFDKDGNQVGTALANISNLANDRTWKFKAMGVDTDNVVTSYELAEITGF